MHQPREQAEVLGYRVRQCLSLLSPGARRNPPNIVPSHPRQRAGLLAALALHPAACCPPGFGSLEQTHRCPWQRRCSCRGKAAPSPGRHQPQPGEWLQWETFQQDQQTLRKLRSLVGCVVRVAEEDVLTEGGRHVADDAARGSERHWAPAPLAQVHIPCPARPFLGSHGDVRAAAACQGH